MGLIIKEFKVGNGLNNFALILSA